MEITMTDPETGAVYLTNPARDIAFFGPQIFEHIAQLCQPDKLTDEDKEQLQEAGLPAEAVLSAWQKLVRFHELCCSIEHKTLNDAIHGSGFLDEPKVAQRIVLQKYAKSMLGAVWFGLRSSTIGDVKPVVVSNLLLTARKMQEEFRNLEKKEDQNSGVS